LIHISLPSFSSPINSSSFFFSSIIRTFEPDGGGWNNIRMAMESTIGLSIAMGRTLVMPPQKKMYLLGKNNKGQQHHFSFVDFFPIAEIVEDNQAFEVVSMKEYLEEEGMKGKLINQVCTHGIVHYYVYLKCVSDCNKQPSYFLIFRM